MAARAQEAARAAELEELLNEDWTIVNAAPLGAASGMTAISPAAGGPFEPVQFAEWAAVFVLERDHPGT